MGPAGAGGGPPCLLQSLLSLGCSVPRVDVTSELGVGVT